MKKKNRNNEFNRIQRFSIRKYSFGAASVAIATYLMFMGNGAVYAAQEGGVEGIEGPEAKIEAIAASAKTGKSTTVATTALDKTQLVAYIAKIESNISSNKYANKTEKSVSELKNEVEAAKSVVVNAQTQGELTSAYHKLETAVSGLENKSVVVNAQNRSADTTNGQPTEGENKKQKEGTDSIGNTGSHDSRNGVGADRGATTPSNEITTTADSISYTIAFSDVAKKEIYLYNEEDTNIDITVNSTAGKITQAGVKGGSGQYLKKGKGMNEELEAEEIDGFGWTYHSILDATKGPTTVRITGKPNDEFKKLPIYTKQESQHAGLGDRYLQIYDEAGAKIEKTSGKAALGYFRLVVKSQTYKYDIQPVAEGDKVVVAGINNLTDPDITKIKEKIKIQYSDKATTQDARLASRKEEVLADRSSVVKDVAVANGTVTVTYNDDSVDTTPVSSVARTNQAPTVELPYSNEANKQIYVYTGENTDLTFKGADENEVKDLYLRGPGDVSWNNASKYGFTTGKVENGAVTGEGSVSKDKKTATIKMTGVTNLNAGQQWTSFIVSKDNDGKLSNNDYKALDQDPNAKQKPGYARFIVKNQTSKYDIKTLDAENKIAVNDANDLTDADLKKIKDNLKIEYAQNNDDARLADKKGQVVEDASKVVDKVEKDGDNLVVTYKDGSKDTKPISDVVRTNNAPEVKIPYSVDGKKDVYVYANEDFDIPVKFTDDSGKVVSATIKRGGNQEQPAKDAAANPNVLDNEYESTVEKISTETTATEANPAIVHIKGNYSKGTPGLDAKKFPTDENGEFPIVTRYATATDKDGRNISNKATLSSYATDPGAFRIVLKAQTAKYDVKELADAEKIKITDKANIPQEELDKIKENLQLEYSKKNKDKNINKDEAVSQENVKKAVADVKQDGDNLVVTYKDGSKDTIPVDKVAKLDKQPAIDEVNKKANDQIAAINNNPALSQTEKDKAIADVNKGKNEALGKIDDATNATDVTTAKEEGTGAVAKVNPVAKEKAKQAVTDALKAKNDALDARKDLTQKEKEDAKAAAKVEADNAIAKIDAQPNTAPTPAEATTAQQAVDTGKTDGTTAIGKINPISKQAALDKIDEVLKAKEKEIDDRTDLTDEEKKEVKDKAKEIADNKKAEINGKKNNADTPEEAETIQGEINTAGTEGAGAITALTKNPAKKPEANKAVDDVANTKKAEIEADNALSPKAKKKLQDEVDAVKKASEEAIKGAKKNADVDQAKKAAETAIAAINSARLPGNKLVAKNPTNLDADEQEKLKKAIEAVNPGATVTVNQDGSADVTLPNGKKETLKQVDLTKDASALETTGGGNNINRPTDKVIVNNPDQLTAEDKEKIKKAVRDVNPNAVVSIDDAGTVTVSTPEGHTAGFPAKELVRTLADAGKDGSGNVGILKPADKVVGNATNPADQEKATEKLKKLNGADATVKYDTEGNATVVLKDGTIATIPAADLFKTQEDTQKVNGGDDINKPNAQTVVADMATLSPEERTKVKDAIKAKVEAVNPGAVVVVDDKGNAIVTTPEGKTAVIDADDLIKKPNETSTAKAGNNINNPADRVQVADKDAVKSPEEIAKIKAVVEAVNPGATVVVDEKGNATVTTPEGKTATIPVSELVKSKADKDNVTGGNQVNTPADRVVVENPAALSEPEKEVIKAKIQAVNPGAEVVFDEKGNATVTTPQGKTATIPASDLVKPKADLADPTKQDAVNKPADKVVVDPELVAADKDIPTEAKDAIKAAVEAVNPGSTVVVDEKGNATVTTPQGKTVVIPKADLVKKEADKETAKAGNNINKPADKVVADKDALTPENIEAIKNKVAAVNPGATVVVDDKGNATVVTPDGQTATIPVTDLVKSPEEAKDEKAGNNVNKPADKVAADKDNLQPADKEKIKEAILKVNPEAKVFVDDQGNATVTTKDGKTATIPVEDLIKDTTQPNAGNKVNTPATKVVVTDPANKAADEEKIKTEILKVNPGATVAFDTAGNATVTTKDGAVATIPAADLAKDATDLTDPDKQDAVKKPADKTLVKQAGKLTGAEKDAIKAAVEKVNPSADPTKPTTVVVDNEGNATVTTPDGKTVVIAKEDLVKTAQEVDGPNAGNNINKPADKVPATPADLTGDKKDEVAAKIKKAVEAVNPGATVFVDDKGNATVTTPEGKTATIPVEDLLKDPAAKETPNAGNKVNTPAEKVLVDPAVLNDPNATLPKDVKDAIQKAVESVNPGAKVVVDDKGNATVIVTNPDGTKTTATIPATDLVKSKAKEDLENAAKQDEIKKPIDETVVANKDALTGPEKEAIKAKVLEVNPGATVAVDDKGNATVTTPEGKTEVIPADDLVKTADEVLTDPKAGNVINKPADRELVTNKDNLTPEDIKAIKDRVAEVNPGASVYVDEKGNATVTTPDGQTATIPVNDLVKTEADKNTANAGNKVNTPADKVLVKDPAKLTAKEVEEIEKKIKEVNPGAEVVFDDKGNATVKTKEGNIATIPVADLVKPKADLLDPAKQDAVKKPADKTLVKNPDSLTPEEKKEIEAKVKAVNPPADGTTVFVDEKGNATVTTKDGKTVVIPKDDLVKTEAEAANEKAGNNINKPADKTVVAKPDVLTPKEKEAIAAKVKAVNPDAKAVFVDDKGNATVTLKDGKSATIPATDLVKTAEDAAKPNAGNKVNAPADKVVVSDPDALTDADKAKITDAIKAVNPNAEKVVFDKDGNATVTLNDGTTATIPAADLVKTEAEADKPEAGNNVNKPADKTVVANPDTLTPEEKKAIEDKVKAVNPGATVTVDGKGNATVTTPEGKTAVIPAAGLTKSKEDAAKPNAGNDVVKPADKTVVANPEQLTDEEKQAITDKLTALNPDAKVVVDDKGNATVTPKDGKPVVIPAADLTKTEADAAKPNAGNDVNTPADKTVVAKPDDLTPEEKKAIEAKVKAVNPGAEVVVDEKGNATVTTPEGKTAVIPASDLTKSVEDAAKPNAGNDVVKPADKTLVKDPAKLTDDEKQAITDKLTALNPDAKVVVDDKGNATVTPKDGKPVVIPAADLTKTEAQTKEPKAGNDVNTPANKTVVANPDALTLEEKKAIEDKVKAVNPGAEVVVDDKGNATVTVNGKTAVIPASDLVIPAGKLADEAKNAKVKTPATRTLVGNKENLTDDEKVAVKKAIEAVNPGATVVVDEKGNATVTLPDGSTATISKEQLVKDKEDAKAKNGGDNLEFDFSKVTVADLKNITPEEKAKFQFMMLGAITDIPEFDLSSLKKETDDQGNTIYTSKNGAKIIIDKDGNATIEKDSKKELAISIDKDGNVTIVTKEGKVLAIPRDDAFRERVYYSQADSKTDKSKLESAIHNLDSLIASQADQLDAAKAKEANALLAEAKEVFGNPNATQAEVDAMVKRLEEFKLNQASVATDDQAANNAANASNGETSEDAANVSKRNNQKELPNTGTSTLGTVLPAIAALLSGVGVFATKKKEDE